MTDWILFILGSIITMFMVLLAIEIIRWILRTIWNRLR